MNSGSSFDGIDVVLAETEIAPDGFPQTAEIHMRRFLLNGPIEVACIVRDSFENRVDMIGLNRLNYICGAVFAEKRRSSCMKMI